MQNISPAGRKDVCLGFPAMRVMIKGKRRSLINFIQVSLSTENTRLDIACCQKKDKELFMSVLSIHFVSTKKFMPSNFTHFNLRPKGNTILLKDRVKLG